MILPNFNGIIGTQFYYKLKTFYDSKQKKDAQILID